MIQATKNQNFLQKGYVIDNQTVKDKYNQNNSIKLETENIKSSPSDAFILVAGYIIVIAGNDTDVAFKNCATFSTCKTKINDMFIDEANDISIVMPKCNLMEYSNNYSDT